jgi:hypothetical protein
MDKATTLDIETMETLIDRHGLDNVLDIISEVCYLKAEHLRTNWQDEVSAEYWNKMGQLVSSR